MCDGARETLRENLNGFEGSGVIVVGKTKVHVYDSLSLCLLRKSEIEFFKQGLVVVLEWLNHLIRPQIDFVKLAVKVLDHAISHGFDWWQKQP